MTEESNYSEESLPNRLDAIRQILEIRQLGIPSYATPHLGTSERKDKQMEAFDASEKVPAQVLEANKTQSYPDIGALLAALPPNPALYETRYVLDQYFRFDTQLVAPGATATIVLPNSIPNGKFGFIDEIHIAQLSGAGSSPNGFLTDTAQSQLYAIVTPDGSTFGGSYKSGRNVIPGGIIPQLTLNSLTASALYLISVQYKIKTRIDVPELDLASVFGKIPNQTTHITDQGSEAGDVAMVERREWPGGPHDFSGWDGDV